LRRPYNVVQMAAQTYIDQVSERVDRLLLRHDELQRVNLLLQQQVEALRLERDQLRQQCVSARQRVNALLAQLPQDQEDSQA
jgi:cell division protein ZapB